MTIRFVYCTQCYNNIIISLLVPRRAVQRSLYDDSKRVLVRVSHSYNSGTFFHAVYGSESIKLIQMYTSINFTEYSQRTYIVRLILGSFVSRINTSI